MSLYSIHSGLNPTFLRDEIFLGFAGTPHLLSWSSSLPDDLEAEGFRVSKNQAKLALRGPWIYHRLGNWHDRAPQHSWWQRKLKMNLISCIWDLGILEQKDRKQFRSKKKGEIFQLNQWQINLLLNIILLLNVFLTAANKWRKSPIHKDKENVREGNS